MMCCAIAPSRWASGWSVITNMRSNRERSEGGISICSPMGTNWSNRPSFGFAAPRSAHRDFRVAVMPALATEIELPHQTGMPLRRT
ncbi:MAG: hypothetical protein BWX50_00085 [Euryarchaeota archaeon ADurb.Bin009]|nr:MAG: hypothetical protein BWX50_00085 [Euryarchaeota archaeon ADurb.Bin009]